MLGIFHTLMMHLDIIGKWFADAGLADLLAQSEVFVDGTSKEALSEKIHNSWSICQVVVMKGFQEV